MQLSWTRGLLSRGSARLCARQTWRSCLKGTVWSRAQSFGCCLRIRTIRFPPRMASSSIQCFVVKLLDTSTPTQPISPRKPAVCLLYAAPHPPQRLSKMQCSRHASPALCRHTACPSMRLCRYTACVNAYCSSYSAIESYRRQRRLFWKLPNKMHSPA